MRDADYMAILDDSSTPYPHEVAEILERARGYLLALGWCQRKAGRAGEPRCLVGAVSQVAGEYAVERAQGGTPSFGITAYPLAALQRALGYRRPERLPRWNDDPERRFSEVVDLLESTAKRVRALEIDYT